MSEKLGQEPAYPSEHVHEKSIYTDGMSKRFYAACAAMQGILSSEAKSLRTDRTGDPAYPVTLKYTFNKEKLIKNAYAIADELLKQESEGTK